MISLPKPKTVGELKRQRDMAATALQECDNRMKAIRALQE